MAETGRPHAKHKQRLEKGGRDQTSVFWAKQPKSSDTRSGLGRDHPPHPPARGAVGGQKTTRQSTPACRSCTRSGTPNSTDAGRAARQRARLHGIARSNPQSLHGIARINPQSVHGFACVDNRAVGHPLPSIPWTVSGTGAGGAPAFCSQANHAHTPHGQPVHAKVRRRACERAYCLHGCAHCARRIHVLCSCQHTTSREYAPNF